MIDASKKTLILTVLALLMFAGYQYFHALTYYEPLNTEQFKRRALFPLWELTCVGCDKVSVLVTPVQRNQ